MHVNLPDNEGSFIVEVDRPDHNQCRVGTLMYGRVQGSRQLRAEQLNRDCYTKQLGVSLGMSVFQIPHSFMLNRIQCAAKFVISATHADLQAGVARIHCLSYMRAYSAIDAHAVEEEEAESLNAEP